MNELADRSPPELRSKGGAVAAGVPATHALSWRLTGLALLFLLAGILLLYRDTAVEMVSIWQRSDTYAHAFLVPPIVLWLVWGRRGVLAAVVPRPTPLGLLPLAAFALVWLIGELAALNSVTQFAMTALLVLATVSIIGLPASRTILFPLAFLFFAVPMGEVLVPQLMEWTADVTVFALRLSGIPVFRDGLNFVIPSGSWSVVEACSGVRYLIASFMVGTLFAHLNYQSTRRRLIFMGAAIVVPIIANWVRAYLIVLLGHVSGNKLAAGVDHLVYGWLFFGVVILLMFWIGARWAQPESNDTAKRPFVPVAEAFAASTRLWWVVVVAAIIVAVPHAAKALVEAGASAKPILAAPVSLSERWSAVGGAAIDLKPAFGNASAEMERVYSSEARNVGVYIGYYRQQDQHRKLIGSGNVLVKSEDPDWATTSDSTRVIDMSGRPLTLRVTTLRSRTPGRGDLLVWRTYWVNGRFTSSDLVARIETLLGKLMGRGDDAAVIVAYTPAADGEATLQGFTAANLAAIETLLNKTRGARP